MNYIYQALPFRGHVERVDANEVAKQLNELINSQAIIGWEFYQINSDKNFVLVESALLFEYNSQSNFDLVIFVHSDPQLRKQKAIERDKITSEEYDNRMKNQLSDEFKLENSDYTIINDFTENTIDEVYKLFKILNNG
jgi:dephospho-CoA kinase